MSGPIPIFDPPDWVITLIKVLFWVLLLPVTAAIGWGAWELFRVIVHLAMR